MDGIFARFGGSLLSLLYIYVSAKVPWSLFLFTTGEQ